MEHYKNLDLADIKYFCEIDKVIKIEQWYPIPNYEDKYHLSSLFRVKSLSRKILRCGKYPFTSKAKILSQTSQPRTRHLGISLCKDGIYKRVGIHVLVARIHIPNPLKLPIVEHLNDIPTDNRPENLMWSTIAENNKHAIERGLINHSKGESRYNSRFTEKDILFIRSSNLSNAELGRLFNIARSSISRIRLRQSWKHI